MITLFSTRTEDVVHLDDFKDPDLDLRKSPRAFTLTPTSNQRRRSVFHPLLSDVAVVLPSWR